MRQAFETLGNATLVFYEDGRSVLATDPWLKGTCYHGSWALDRPLTESEMQAVLSAEYIWISHGHPDHFHPQSLKLLPRDKKLLLPDHYSHDIRDYLAQQGFAVDVMPYREWHQLSPQLRCLCLDNENQDSILVAEFADNLIVNLNDSPLCGEKRFIRGLVRAHERRRTYMAALCSNDADMFNIIDPQGRQIIDPPDQRKPGMVWGRARIAASLGVGNYVSSASQHIYVRSDSVWANPYGVTWSDVVKHWTRPDIRIIEPFVIVDLATGEYQKKHPTQTSDMSQITNETNGDDWNERLSEIEWAKFFEFFNAIELLPRFIEYVDFTVGGECRRINLNANIARADSKLRGISFHAPRNSLVKAIGSGYFDDMLIGNFMHTELHHATLYPHFSPIVAKLRGSAKIRTIAEWRRFKYRYFRRNPLGYAEWHLGEAIGQLTEFARRWADLLGIKTPLKRFYRKVLGDPVT